MLGQNPPAPERVGDRKRLEESTDRVCLEGAFEGDQISVPNIDDENVGRS